MNKCGEKYNAIFKGDDTNAFGNNFLKIKVSNPKQFKISKILFVVNNGSIVKEFEDENYFQDIENILYVNFTSEETQKLGASNVGNLVVYDENDLQATCTQFVRFNAQNGVINDARSGS